MMDSPLLPPGLLKGVSRSFYLTLRVLPGAVREQIGLAYLLARTTDTIADTGLVSVDQRLNCLARLRDRILGDSRTPLDFGELARQQGSAAEKLLLEKSEPTLAALDAMFQPDRQLVRDVLTIIISGQELDLRRFAGATAENPAALRTDDELDDYTYRVAGCVGEFWTKICRAHLFASARLDDSFLLINGVRFGKGLQLVNILRDLPSDLRLGRCYLPSGALGAAGLAPKDLRDPGNDSKLRPVYNPWLDRAEAHLAAGWAYTNALPRRQVRVRLACAWPILIGLRTIALLRTGNVLDASRRIKVPRGEVKSMMVKSVLLYPFPPAWRRLAA